MGKVVSFGGSPQPKDENLKPLTEEDIKALFDPLKEGLFKLYPSQMGSVDGIVAVGEAKDSRKVLVGLLFWTNKKTGMRSLSTFIAFFLNDKLEKISFLEAKNNYWDWDIAVKTLKPDFHIEEMVSEILRVKKEFTGG